MDGAVDRVALAPPVRSVGDENLARPVGIAPAEHIGLLGLEELVGVEEVLDLDEAMGPNLVEPLDVRLVRIADGDAQHLEVLAVLIAHLETADRAGPDPTAGERRLVDQQERVGVVAVTTPGVVDEAVVEVVMDGRREDPVEPEDAGGLIPLVLVPAAPRDLDDDFDDGGVVGGGRTHPPSVDGRPRAARENARRNQPARWRS